MDKLEFMPNKFSEKKKELELIELLKKKKKGDDKKKKWSKPVFLFFFSVEFLDRCCNHGVAIYESDEIGVNQAYGILN